MDAVDAYASSSNGSDEQMDEVVEGQTTATGNEAQSADASKGGTSERLEGQNRQTTKAGMRIAELDEVEQRIAQLMHLAGCTLASLHPEPLSSFTTRTISVEEESDDDEPKQPKEPLPEQEQKGADFAKYAEAYYLTLNDIQLSLRTSIRHLRLARASPAPLLDPSFGSLGNSGGAAVRGGGIALGTQLAPLKPSVPQWPPRQAAAVAPKLSVGALELQREAWRELNKVLEK